MHKAHLDVTTWINLIDCRPLSAYLAEHIIGAASFPAAELFDRLHELPSNDHALTLCGDAESLNQAQTFLSQKSYQIAQTIELDSPTLNALRDAQYLRAGFDNPRLWQASPLLERLPSFLEKANIKQGKGIDLACGAGRDAVWLAMHGWQMTAVDCMSQALAKTADLAKRRDCEIQTLQIDLEQQAELEGLLGNYDLAIVVRYLHRPLLAKIDDLLASGGVVAYQTFMQGAEQFGSPKNPNRLLRPNELAGVFKGYTILLDEVEYLPDGRPVSAFIAQKP